MAEKDNPGPSLELPSLFDRKKKRRSTSDEASAPSESSSAPEPTPAPTPEPAPEPTPAAAPGPTPDPAAPAPVDAGTSPAATAPAAEDTRVAEPAPTRQPEPAPAPRPAPTPVAPTAAPSPAPAPAPASAPAPAPARTTGGTTRTQPAMASTPATVDPETGVDDEQESTGRSLPSLPELGAAVAALVVGALVGLLGVVLTFLGLKGCELVTGTDSCGGPGLLVLVAIVVAMVLAGAALLRLFGVPDAGSVSFLGVGVLMVVVLVLLIDSLASPVMLVVIPALTAGCFALARWVTTQLSDDVMADR